MPPKKKVAPAGDAGDAPGPARAFTEADGISVEDLGLPRSIVQRLAKGVLPSNTQIAKDALLAMSKSATVFVNYLTAEAGEAALKRGTKRIYPQDVISAIHEIEFGGFEARLQAELAIYQEKEDDKRKQRSSKGGATGAPSKGPATAEWDADGEHLAKRARTGGESNGAEDSAMNVDADDGDETLSDHENDEIEEEEDEVEDDVIEEEEEEPESQIDVDVDADKLEQSQRREDSDEALEENDSD